MGFYVLTCSDVSNQNLAYNKTSLIINEFWWEIEKSDMIKKTTKLLSFWYIWGKDCYKNLKVEGMMLYSLWKELNWKNYFVYSFPKVRIRTFTYVLLSKTSAIVSYFPHATEILYNRVSLYMYNSVANPVRITKRGNPWALSLEIHLEKILTFIRP